LKLHAPATPPLPLDRRGADASLPRGAKGQDLGKTAQEFEALLLRNVVESMQKTAKLDGESSGNQLTDHLIEDALANHLAKSGGIGLARYLEGQLDEPATVPRSDMHLTLEKWVRYQHADGVHPNDQGVVNGDATDEVGAMSSARPSLVPTRVELAPLVAPSAPPAGPDPSGAHRPREPLPGDD